MVYHDKSGRRVVRRVRRGKAPADPGLDDAKTQYILQAAADCPGYTPDEVYAEIRDVRGRHDITRAMVHATLPGSRRTPARRWFRR
ncbi:hypothetical protein [Actinophytocola sp.]|uniref:hypothetical protein n=1 Tax=Actinophytocola sp. TaxID=1872138 RepID=UPI002D7EDC1F|nr:hypothetical protein [Actinophytocola sp.]HET9138889.1 hypothetical protein [Actinophytocola sp.]